MAIIIEETDVTRRREGYANLIQIHGNAHNALDSTILTELQELEYHGAELRHAIPLTRMIESAADFVQRTFEVGGRTITGLEVMQVVKLYAAQRHAEYVASQVPEPEPEPEPPSEP